MAKYYVRINKRHLKMKKVEEKIQKVYEYMVDYIDQNGFPPAIRDICGALGIKSTSTVYAYTEKLKERGLLNKTPQKNRSVVPSIRTEYRTIPLIGVVRAGTPVFAAENLEGYIPLPNEFGSADMFALKVSGESMINAGINNNDIIIIRKTPNAENGEIVVALIDDEATVKRFYKKDGKIILHPENDTLNDMVFDDVVILGTVKGLIRKL